MRLCKYFLCPILFCALCAHAHAQDSTRHFHPGLTASTGPYFLMIKTPVHADSLKYIHSTTQSEFGMGISLEYRFTNHLALIFSPNIGIVKYDLNYLFLGREWYNIRANEISGVAELPIDIEYYFKRHKKYSPYILAGASLEKTLNTNMTSDQGYVPLNTNNQCLEAGGGIEFYLRHFMLKVQAKYSAGIDNMISQNVTVFGETVTGVYSSEATLTVSFISY